MQLPARYITITREGWYYLLVLAFIIGGAILREVNLMVILAGMMIGPLIFSWRWVSLSLGNLSAVRRLPPRMSAGDPLVVELEVTNHRRRLTSWALALNDQIEREHPTGEDAITYAECAIPAVRPDGSAAVSYRCLITRRGRYRFGPLRLSTRFPLGLVRAGERLDIDSTLIVCPRLGRLTKRWEQWIEAERSGVQSSSPRRGLVEGEYYGMREWRAGDSQRWIHWRTSARLNELAVRQFEEQRNADVALVLDLWAPSDPSDGALGNVEVVVSAGATAVMDLSRRGSHMLSVAVHGRELAEWSAAASATFAQDVIESLAMVEYAEQDRLLETLDLALGTAIPGSRLIIFSTRTLDISGIVAELSARHGGRQQATLARLVWADVTTSEFASVYSLE